MPLSSYKPAYCPVRCGFIGHGADNLQGLVTRILIFFIIAYGKKTGADITDTPVRIALSNRKTPIKKNRGGRYDRHG